MDVAAFFVVFLIFFALKPSRIDGTYLDWLTHGLLPTVSLVYQIVMYLFFLLYFLTLQ